MKLFHRTSHADAILRQGFRDSTGTYMTVNEYSGVWLSNVPLDINEGAVGDVVLTVEIPEEVVAEHEWVEDGKGYREFLVPAEVVNRYGPPEVFEREEPVHPDLIRRYGIRERIDPDDEVGAT